MNVLAIIPARINSKGIPEKNLIKIGGYTLVERALLTAMNTRIIDDIIVSTDSLKIKNITNKYGNYAPFLRPKHLATDSAGSLGVIKHSLKWAQKKYNKVYDYVVLLEPPSPFRLPTHINQGVKLAIDKEASSVVSLVKVGDYHPIRMKTMDPDGQIRGVIDKEPDGLRRQDQEFVYIRNSAVYVFSAHTIFANKLWGEKPFGFEMDRNLFGINIDEPNDLRLIKAFYQEMLDKKLTESIEILTN
ncbi:acylneuraminate cytidylyltransferase family protein [Candidatus Thioglobus sp.]|nr:acylneuraminate cytidylyltransferase family protein [Candidatus Thioglobus sp.]